MGTPQRLFVVLTTLVLTIGTASFAAAQPPPEPAAPPQQEQAELRAEGELLRVDTEAKTLTIRTSDGSEMEFSYNEATDVAGAQEETAGLATETGSHVTVYFEQQGNARIATRIEVSARR
jgi:hypothetical protein